MTNQRGILAVILSVALVAIAVLAVGQMKGTPDRELSLSKSSVFDVTEPPPELANVTEPGERPVVPADFPEQPPLVPHGVIDWLPITFDENQCVDCHAVEEKLEGEATPIPQSHYVDLRHAPKQVQEDVVGARYNCIVCHAVPGDSAVLVGNTFGEGR